MDTRRFGSWFVDGRGRISRRRMTGWMVHTNDLFKALDFARSRGADVPADPYAYEHAESSDTAPTIEMPALTMAEIVELGR